MSESPNDYQRWRDFEAARLVASDSIHTDIVRELLILSCHSSPLAHQFFESRLDSQELLSTLLDLAVEDYSGDAQMTASYWASRFPPGMLAPHAPKLEAVAANELGSVADHARRALEAIRGFTLAS